MFYSCKRKDFKKDNLLLTIMITNICNYNCIYCIENIPYNITEKKFIDIKQIFIFIEKIHLLYADKKISIELYGGEPTLHPEFYTLCKKLSTYNYITYIDIYTNLSQDISLYKKILNFNVRLSTTFHYTHDRAGDIFYKKIYSLNKISDKIYCNIMFNSQNTVYVYNLFKKIKTNMPLLKLECGLIFSTPNFKSYYDNKSYKLFKNINSLYNEKFNYKITDEKNNFTIQITAFNSFNFKNWKCSAGFNTLFIDVFGNVYPCNTIYRSRHKLKNINIKNIFTDGIKSLQLNNTICPVSVCPPCTSLITHNINNETHDILNDTDKYFV